MSGPSNWCWSEFFLFFSHLPPSSVKEKPSDPVEWTVSDVVDYFTEAGFAEQASAFQEQVRTYKRGRFGIFAETEFWASVMACDC